jgi:predicted TPR repeat methyltransferase
MGKLDLAARHYESAIAQRPDWIEARFEYAVLLERKGALREAIGQWQALLALSPGTQDIRFHIAALEQALSGGADASSAPGQAPRSYIEGHFDGYAGTYDDHLTKKLDYHGPELLLHAVKEAGVAGPLDILDLGCGTGLVGELFKPMARRLVGMDLSAGMLERARERGIYDELIRDDLAGGLNALQDNSFDLVLSGDVFTYIGDLGRVFEAIGKVLRVGGLLALITEAAAGETDNSTSTAPDWRLLTTRRYEHSRAYLERLYRENAMEAIVVKRVAGRRERDVPVQCWLMVGKMRYAGTKATTPGFAGRGWLDL